MTSIRSLGSIIIQFLFWAFRSLLQHAAFWKITTSFSTFSIGPLKCIIISYLIRSKKRSSKMLKGIKLKMEPIKTFLRGATTIRRPGWSTYFTDKEYLQRLNLIKPKFTTLKRFQTMLLETLSCISSRYWSLNLDNKFYFSRKRTCKIKTRRFGSTTIRSIQMGLSQVIGK